MHRTAGASFSTVEIAGKTYTLRPMKTGQYAAMEAYVISQREDPLVIAAKACATAPEALHATIWDAAIRAARSARTATAAEVAAFENSVRGLAWKILQCVKQDHPEIKTVDDAIILIEQAGESRLAELQAKIHVASGEDDLKNSSGQVVEETATGTAVNPPAGQ